ncbi:MAG TPA: universal stress protein [Burkholderiaceae bacterium]|nr:universal stress protein [Burkholderiaceae bacterium]
MMTKILVTTDGSELSRRAIDAAVDLARNLGAALVGFTAVPAYPYASVGEIKPGDYSDFQARVGALANARLAAVETAARAASVECTTRMAETDQPWRAIIDTARDSGCDVIVMASHGRAGVSGVLLGSETQRVLTHSTLPVLVIR